MLNIDEIERLRGIFLRASKLESEYAAFIGSVTRARAPFWPTEGFPVPCRIRVTVSYETECGNSVVMPSYDKNATMTGYVSSLPKTFVVCIGKRMSPRMEDALKGSVTVRPVFVTDVRDEILYARNKATELAGFCYRKGTVSVVCHVNGMDDSPITYIEDFLPSRRNRSREGSDTEGLVEETDVDSGSVMDPHS